MKFVTNVLELCALLVVIIVAVFVSQVTISMKPKHLLMWSFQTASKNSLLGSIGWELRICLEFGSHHVPTANTHPKLYTLYT
jgi:hypothetical protein